MTIGHGTTLTGSTTGPIGKLTNIDWSGLVADDIDVTDFDSPDNVKVYEGGLLDAGEITAELRYDPTLFNTILDAVLARASRSTHRLRPAAHQAAAAPAPRVRVHHHQAQVPLRVRIMEQLGSIGKAECKAV